MLVTPSPGWRTCATPRPSSGPPSCTTHTSPGAVEWNAVRRLNPSTISTTAPTTPTRLTPASIDFARSVGFKEPLRDVDRRADGDLVVELDDVRDPHADAAVRRRRADRVDRIGAVDPGAVEDAHPARLERVLRRAAGHDRPGQLAGPVAVRHVPGRVHGLVLDVVQARRRLEADLPDRDAVRLGGLELRVERQLERVAVHDDDRAVALVEVARADLRLELAGARDERAVGGRRDQRPADVAVQQGGAHGQPGPALVALDAAL